jgi:hypothetical protein
MVKVPSAFLVMVMFEPSFPVAVAVLRFSFTTVPFSLTTPFWTVIVLVFSIALLLSLTAAMAVLAQLPVAWALATPWFCAEPARFPRPGVNAFALARPANAIAGPIPAAIATLTFHLRFLEFAANTVVPLCS